MSARRLRLIVIVGGGVAGLRAAERLVERGYDGRIEIVAAERHAPYRRPGLTEGVLTGHASPAALRLRARLEGRVRWHHGVSAVGLDARARRVLLDDGRYGPYEGLIVATGMTPRLLPGARRATDRVQTLRTVDDALRLRATARRVRSVLVVGGGLVGAEAAASLRAGGTAVTVVDIAPTLLHDAVGPRVGVALTQLHRRRGVRVETDAAVQAWDHAPGEIRAILRDGREIGADAALVAIGAQPDVEWLRDSGADVIDGVLCGPTTHVVGLDDVVACGDCARWPNLRFDAVPRRVEQWATAVAMGRHAADALLDGRDHARPFAPVPWGWTEQWGVRIHLLGRPLAGSLGAVDGDPDRLRGALATQDGDGRFVGAVVAERPAVSVALHRAIGAACPKPDLTDAAAWRPPEPTGHRAAPAPELHARGPRHPFVERRRAAPAAA